MFMEQSIFGQKLEDLQGCLIFNWAEKSKDQFFINKDGIKDNVKRHCLDINFTVWLMA